MIKWKTISHFPRNLVLLLILLYQKTISPDHGIFKARYPYGFCRFYPTCSEYGFQVIQKRGILIGAPLLVWRILRCNPWSKGGVDQP
ncbi:MAG: membrane protein insertion efficiency factor YidD [Candidatus Magasanikbacteria bacterium]|nr:membrane protein insertion efficiency factor YidD [Candidatus Magasanikbacteria bacterium]